MRERKKCRSDAYQFKFNEILCGDATWAMFDSSRSYASTLNPFHYDEYVLAWEDQLKERVWELIDLHLTEIQKEIIHLLYKDGYTQDEVAKIRNVNQSSVVKSIIGNCNYKIKDKNNLYGGSLKKIRNLIAKDELVQELMAKIKERQEENG